MPQELYVAQDMSALVAGAVGSQQSTRGVSSGCVYALFSFTAFLPQASSFPSLIVLQPPLASTSNFL